MDTEEKRLLLKDSELEHAIEAKMEEWHSLHAESRQLLSQERIDSMAWKCVTDVLHRSKIESVIKDYQYFPECHPCTEHLPSQCPLLCHQCNTQHFKPKKHRSPVPTIDESTPVTFYFPESEDNSNLEPCLESLEDCSVMSYVRSFTEDAGQKVVQEFIANWNLPAQWKYSIRFLGRSENENASLFKFTACFSQPSSRDPVPEAVAHVCLTLSVYKMASEQPYSVSYVLEGSEILRTEHLMPSWLENIIETKKKLSEFALSLQRSEESELTAVTVTESPPSTASFSDS